MVHSLGNLGSADFRGVARKVSIAPVDNMRNVIRKMTVHKDAIGLSEFELCYEGTQHGPSLEFSSMFFEISSTLNERKNPYAVKVIAGALIDSIKCNSTVPVALGMGGVSLQ